MSSVYDRKAFVIRVQMDEEKSGNSKMVIYRTVKFRGESSGELEKKNNNDNKILQISIVNVFFFLNNSLALKCY